jgi:hypothetical protein
VSLHQIVSVVAVRHRFMPTAGPVPVALVVPATIMVCGAVDGIGRRDCNLVLFDAGLAHVVQMAIVQVIDVSVMSDRGVATAGAMLMGVIGVGRE